MGKARPQTIVLDTGALIAFERGAARMRALVREALSEGARIVVPAGALGQAWRGAARQAPLRALLKGPTTVVPALDQVMAEAAGVLCGRTGTADVIDASIVLVARRDQAVVLTSDADDLRRLDPKLDLERGAAKRSRGGGSERLEMRGQMALAIGEPCGLRRDVAGHAQASELRALDQRVTALEPRAGP
jgi:rRNA-processing protein FCF1